MAPWLGPFERRHPYREDSGVDRKIAPRAPDVCVVGLGRYGRDLALRLRDAGLTVIGIDFDPEVVRSLRATGLDVRFGDASAAEFLETLPLGPSCWIVSSLPDLPSHRALVHALQQAGAQSPLVLVSRESLDDGTLVHLGSPTVIYPTRDAVEHAVTALVRLVRH